MLDTSADAEQSRTVPGGANFLMRWGTLALFLSGLFSGGAIDHLILALRRSQFTPYGLRSGVGGNWVLAAFDGGPASFFLPAAHAAGPARRPETRICAMRITSAQGATALRYATRLGPESIWGKILVTWYGFYQAGHLIFNSLYLLHPGRPPFPPPAGGWLSQTVHFLNGMAASDLVNAVLALVFVYGFFRRAPWRMWLGTLTLTISMYAAIVFTYGTMATGAWSTNLPGYLWFYVPFIPVVVLFIFIGVWAAQGKG